MIGGPDLSWRRFRVLLEGLPASSAFSSALLESGEVEVEEADSSEWSLTNQLQGLTVDLLASANWQRGDGKSPRPKPIMSSHRKAKKPSESDSLGQDEIRDLLKGLSPGLE